MPGGASSARIVASTTSRTKVKERDCEPSPYSSNSSPRAAASTIRAVDAAPGIYNVGGGEEAALRDALALLEEIAGRPLELTYGPPQPGDN
ncbi:MAG: hypothetical protein ACTHKS_16305, partial [Gaiellaceae bacterium]